LQRVGDDFGLAHALVAFAQSCLDQKIFDAAEAQLQRAIELLERIAPDSAQLGFAVMGLGRVREAQRRPAEARAFFERAAEIGEVAPAGTRLALVATLDLATLHHAEGR